MAGRARVEEIEIVILESFPVQVNVVARGNLPDGCTAIDRIEQQRQGDAFLVTITTVRPASQMCTQALVPFEQVISLDVAGLKAGTYMVNVNGVQDTFELAVDNTLSDP
jgi:inhibitor of cysteine peptidase